jgi:hypothetical protein
MRHGYFLAISGFVALAAHGACSSKGGGSGSSSSGSAACAPKDPACPALSIKSDCLALVDNSGKDRFVLRLAQLSVTAPKALTTKLVRNIVGDGVNLNLKACNIQSGKGTFNLITEFDVKSGKLKTGGAKYEAKPENGYCYVVDQAKGVVPVEVNAKFDGNKFSTDTIKKMVLPIYIDETPTSKVVYLPLSEARLSEGTISADHNCIGSFNATKLDPYNNCLPDDMVDYFTNAAKLDGYVTLEEADAVVVDQASQTLCVLLSGDPDKYGEGASTKKCKRNAGKIVLEGDWCSTSNSAGGCKDAMRLTAELAASAVKLRSDCQNPTTSGAGGGGTGGMGSGGAGGS